MKEEEEGDDDGVVVTTCNYEPESFSHHARVFCLTK